jgi:HrpA-like RNA helicase
MNQLPIDKYEEEIVKKVLQNQITCIVGQPGCGKTTRYSLKF